MSRRYAVEESKGSPRITISERKWGIFLGILLLVGIRLLAILIIPPSADEVIQLYMADDIAHFAHFPIYFSDQALMGALESYLIAPLFRLFGFTFLGARILHSLFYLSFAALFLWTVRRLFTRELTTYLFILLSVLPFPALLFTTVIGWAETPFFAILSLVLLLKMAEKVQTKTGWVPLTLGFVCGLALWCNPLFLIWLVPIAMSGFWLIPVSGIRVLFIFFLGLLTGLFPVWIHGLETGILMSVSDRGGNGFVNLGQLPHTIYLLFSRMKYFLSTFSFGSTSPWVDSLIRWLSFVPFSVFAISFVPLALFVFRSRRTLSLREKVFYGFVVAPPLVFAVLYGSRDFTRGDEGMRFLLQLLMAYLFAVAWQLERMRSKVWKGGILGLLLGVLILGNLFSGRELLRRKSELTSLVRFLEKEGLPFGLADTNIAYSLNVLSGHRIVATALPHYVNPDSIWKRVREEGSRFIILERRNPHLRDKLENDPNLKRRSIGSFDIFYGEPAYLRALLGLPRTNPRIGSDKPRG